MKPLPVVAGSKQPVNASTRWATGKMFATSWIHCGASPIGKKTPERKISGNIVMLEIAGADSALRMKLATARPSELMQSPPSSTATTAAGISRGSIETSKASIPTTTRSSTEQKPVMIAEHAHAPRKTPGGSGVPTTRLMIPRSRAVVTAKMIPV